MVLQGAASSDTRRSTVGYLVRWGHKARDEERKSLRGRSASGSPETEIHVFTQELAYSHCRRCCYIVVAACYCIRGDIPKMVNGCTGTKGTKMVEVKGGKRKKENAVITYTTVYVSPQLYVCLSLRSIPPRSCDRSAEVQGQC